MEKINNYVNGRLVAPVNGHYMDVYEPAKGKVYALSPDSDQFDIDKAVDAAKKAFPSWSAMPVNERSDIIYKIAEIISRDIDKFAEAESLDNGKPIRLAKTVDIPRAIQNFEFFASAILHFFSESHSMEDYAVNYTLRHPIGIVGAISPWNLPLYLFTWKTAPALAAGNCVIAKPSEFTPMTSFLLSQACIEAGLPPGVFNIVHGYGHKIGRAISSSHDIHAITFTGGTKTGADIASVAAPMFKKLSLELGGKNPNIIFADCNYDEMLETTIRSSFSNQGEICLCGSRIFIEKSLYDKFKKDFVERTKALKIGDPKDESTDQGAIVSKQHLEKILYYIDLAKQEGGKILCGGKQVHFEGELKDGWFIEPTVIEGLTHTCRTNQEEIFGPVVTLIPFENEDEAVIMANSTMYGLASILWTNDLSRAHRISVKLNSGIVWVNCWMLRDLRTPFGGIKSSGVGREGGFEALRFFTEPKNVCIKFK